MGDSRDSLRGWGLERPFVAMQKHGKCQGGREGCEVGLGLAAREATDASPCQDVVIFQTMFNDGKLEDAFEILELSESKVCEKHSRN